MATVINFAKFPYLRIALLLIAGIFIFNSIQIGSLVLALILVCVSLIYVFGVIYLKLHHPKPFILGSLLLIGVFVFGGLIITLKNENLEQIPLNNYENKKLICFGAISEKLNVDGNPKFILENEYFKTPQNDIKADHSKMIIKFAESDTLAAKYKPGDRVVVSSVIKTLVKNTNPEAFDYASYLRTKSIVFQTFVKEKDHEFVDSKGYSSLWKSVGKTSDYATSILTKYIHDAENNAIAQALLLGQKLLLSEDIYKSYTDTGAIHVLSVSGLHVAIFISLFVWLMSLITSKNKWWNVIKVTILLMIVWYYVFLTGMSPSVIRAGSMVSFYIIGTHFFKGTNSFNLLSIAAICMLIYNPFYLFQASFQFSYLSLLSILYFQPKIAALWQPTNKLLKFIWDLINVSLAAQVLVFPVTVFYFHQFPVYFAVSGIVAVPLVTIIIYIGTLLIVFEPFLSSFNLVLGPILNFLIEALNESIKFISSWPGSTISGIWVSNTSLLLLLAAITLMIIWIETRHIKMFYCFLGLLFLLVLDNLFLASARDTQSKLIVYDTYGANLVDIVSGNSIVTILTGKLEKKSEQFAALNNRIKHGVAHQESLKSPENNSKMWFVHQKRIYINNSVENPSSIRSENIDILVITKNKFNDPILWLNKFNPKLVILDRNVPPWVEKKWYEQQTQHHFKLHAIKTQGAIEVDLMIK